MGGDARGCAGMLEISRRRAAASPRMHFPHTRDCRLQEERAHTKKSVPPTPAERAHTYPAARRHREGSGHVVNKSTTLRIAYASHQGSILALTARGTVRSAYPLVLSLPLCAAQPFVARQTG